MKHQYLGRRINHASSLEIVFAVTLDDSIKFVFATMNLLIYQEIDFYKLKAAIDTLMN